LWGSCSHLLVFSANLSFQQTYPRILWDSDYPMTTLSSVWHWGEGSLHNEIEWRKRHQKFESGEWNRHRNEVEEMLKGLVYYAMVSWFIFAHSVSIAWSFGSHLAFTLSHWSLTRVKMNVCVIELVRERSVRSHAGRIRDQTGNFCWLNASVLWAAFTRIIKYLTRSARWFFSHWDSTHFQNRDSLFDASPSFTRSRMTVSSYRNGNLLQSVHFDQPSRKNIHLLISLSLWPTQPFTPKIIFVRVKKKNTVTTKLAH
jgi:hypothetical protein